MTSIKYVSITKSFGDLQVIKGVDLDIQEGELVVFIGPSGCGKSTLLRMIAGLEDATSGDLFIGDKRVNDVSPKDRNIAMVFQNYALYPHMTVADNMSFGMKLRGASKAERAAAVKKAADILGLEDLLDRQPRALSGGQRQRVAMGRAIVRDPDVFLMDEPLSNLDAKLRTQMRVEIKKLQHRLGTTTIYVTHDQVEAMTLADRIAVLHGGYVQQFGTPGHLYNHPVNKFVAGFLGSPSINFIRAKVQDDSLILPSNVIVKLSPERAALLAGMSEVDLGIRPELIAANTDAVATDDCAVWNSTISLSESLGGEILVYASIGDQDITIKVGNRDDVAEGSAIQLSFDLESAHLFDVKNGACLNP